MLLFGGTNANVANINNTVDTIPKRETIREASKSEISSDQNQAITSNNVEKQVKVYFEDIPELVEVARCESTFRHTDRDGNISRGKVNSADVGVMQINEYYHLEDSKALGYDIYSLRGNMAYAKYLYNKEGITPWASSGPCWHKKVTHIQQQQELALAK